MALTATKIAPPANGTHGSRSGTVRITADSLRAAQVRPDVAAKLYPQYPDAAHQAVVSLIGSMAEIDPRDHPIRKDTGLPELARTWNARTYFSAPGQVLRGFARSALLSAWFENERAARAWQAFVEAQAKAQDDHSADKEGVDGANPELDRIAERAMDAIQSAAIWTEFAAVLAVNVATHGDGEEIEATYTPKATEEPRAVTPRAATTLAAFLAA